MDMPFFYRVQEALFSAQASSQVVTFSEKSIYTHMEIKDLGTDTLKIHCVQG